MQEISVRLGDHEIQRCSFNQDVISIGRARDNDIVIDNLRVSRRHARIVLQNEKFYITDLDSAGGLSVNGITCRYARLRSHDTISIGKHRLVIFIEGSADSKNGSNSLGNNVSLTVTPVRGKPTEYPLRQQFLSIGRSRRAKIRILDWFIRDFEAVCINKDDSHTIQTLDGHRLQINDAMITEAGMLDGDMIKFGAASAQISIRSPQLQEDDFSPEADAVQDMLPEEPLQPIPGGNAAASQDAPERLEIQTIMGAEMNDNASDSASRNTSYMEDETNLDLSLPEPKTSNPQIALWEKALGNKSLAVRKHAALQLKQLTGRDYEP